MAHKGPHISISPDYVVNRILRINIDDFAEWPESVRHLAIAIAEELFLVAYNPFINVETVRNSVHARFERESMALAHYFANAIGEGITMFWSAYEAERSFREELISALRNILPNECILSSPSALVASATDATDLRMELPLLVVEPDSAEQVAALVKLANDMKFALIPRGGGSGMTGFTSGGVGTGDVLGVTMDATGNGGSGCAGAGFGGSGDLTGWRSLSSRIACIVLSSRFPRFSASLKRWTRLTVGLRFSPTRSMTAF